ncbi:alpha/beta fold hydrolase [Candidatus Sumerlaeota bacterium]|nr:alpha/beta fold hydrolase [Candidatus Sumerlaeota bacterium]
MHYVDEGTGDPIVMLHGNPTWSFYFRELIKALRVSHRVIALDHIGCGLSDKPGDDRYTYTLKSRVDDLDALLDHLEVRENITLVLHDWGGGIGMTYATRHPNRIKRIIAMNTAGFLLPKTKMFPWPLWLGRNTALGAFLIRQFNAFSYIATHVACKRGMEPDVRRAYTVPYDSWENRIATLRFVQDIPLKPGDPAWDLMKGTDDKLEQFRAIPVLLCWGMRDFVFDHHFLRVWRERLPQAEAHEFHDAGHYTLEDAHERIVPLVKKFLEANPI